MLTKTALDYEINRLESYIVKLQDYSIQPVSNDEYEEIVFIELPKARKELSVVLAKLRKMRTTNNNRV